MKEKIRFEIDEFNSCNINQIININTTSITLNLTFKDTKKAKKFLKLLQNSVEAINASCKLNQYIV